VDNVGTTYGEEVSFTTVSVSAPVVATSSVKNVTAASAVVVGEVTEERGKPVTERGVVYSVTPEPTINDAKVVSGSGLGSFSAQLTNLKSSTTYYVRAYATNEEGTAYGNALSFTTTDHPCVDLGLSVNWATYNIGATAPEEIGDFYQWGEVEPDYNGDDYKFYDENDNLTKYNSSDNKYILDKEDDAATVNWGDKWHMPTVQETEELLKNCEWEDVTINGVNCIKLTSKVPGYTNKSIIFPIFNLRS
jgi:hypothetical protein